MTPAQGAAEVEERLAGVEEGPNLAQSDWKERPERDLVGHTAVEKMDV
jgi:hypothetical protein